MLVRNAQYAIARVNGDKFYGAKATINVWRPYVENNNNNDEFSLSQIWVTAGSDGELNTIEAGWRVCYLTNYSN